MRRRTTTGIGIRRIERRTPPFPNLNRVLWLRLVNCCASHPLWPWAWFTQVAVLFEGGPSPAYHLDTAARMDYGH